MMVKKALLAASLALLATGLGRPAAAAPVFLEPYGNIFSARTFLASPADLRPMDALQNAWDPNDPEPRQRFLVSPFVRTFDVSLPGPDLDVFMVGGGLAYANSTNWDHPWSINFNYFRTDLEAGPFEEDVDGYDINGKYVLWMSPHTYRPVVSFVGRYFAVDDVLNRWAAHLAVDQRIGRRLFFTGNIGYAVTDFDAGGDEDGLVAGLGITWMATQRLSISGDYSFGSDAVAFQSGANWSIAAMYVFDELSAIRLGGGGDGLFFANYIARFDW